LTLAPGTIYDRINVAGSIEPWATQILLSKLNGTVAKIQVREGQKVKKGDVLAMIESPDCRINQDRSGEADYPVTSRCTVAAPMDGVVGQLQAKAGQRLSVDEPIAEIFEIDRVKAVVGIPEADVDAVRGLTTVNVVLQTPGDRVLTGKVHFFSSSPETADRLFRLELVLDNSSGDILPGMTVRAEVVERIVENAIVIPTSSVVSQNGVPYVYVENDGVVEKRSVKLGIVEKGMVEVTEGLAAGEQLLVAGYRDGEDKQKVTVVKVLDPRELTP
jgi:membrane fusion protein (multidrug efflux system)